MHLFKTLTMQHLSYNIKSHWENDKKQKLINSTGEQKCHLRRYLQNAVIKQVTAINSSHFYYPCPSYNS